MAEGNLSARASIERQDEFGLLTNTFNQMADTIQAKVVTLRRFVADAAHELGTPLTALRTNLELIENDDILPALEQVDRMDSLTRCLLDLSQLEGIPSEIQRQEIALAGLLRDLDEVYASSLLPLPPRAKRLPLPRQRLGIGHRQSHRRSTSSYY